MVDQFVEKKSAREGIGSWRGLSPLKKLIWLLLTLLCLIYMLPIILVCGVMGTVLTARSLMYRAFDYRDNFMNRSKDKASGTEEPQDVGE